MACLAVGLQHMALAATMHYGFDVSNRSVPRHEMRSGGPGRDGIPSIDAPRFVSVSEADYMQDEDLVLSVTRGGETRVYPFRILVWHEIVNDRIGDEAFMVTYCPLCETAMVFDRTVDRKLLEFGVSGLLYQSDVLMYDRETESLWSQLGMEAVSGPMRGRTLTWLPAQQMTWARWKTEYPEGRVLSMQTCRMRSKRGAYPCFVCIAKCFFMRENQHDEDRASG